MNGRTQIDRTEWRAIFSNLTAHMGRREAARFLQANFILIAIAGSQC